jgi:hypothetical protein
LITYKYIYQNTKDSLVCRAKVLNFHPADFSRQSIKIL